MTLGQYLLIVVAFLAINLLGAILLWIMDSIRDDFR